VPSGLVGHFFRKSGLINSKVGKCQKANSKMRDLPFKRLIKIVPVQAWPYYSLHLQVNDSNMFQTIGIVS